MQAELLLYTILCLSTINCTPCSKVESIDISTGEIIGDILLHNDIGYSSTEWYEVTENDTKTRYGCPCISRICLWKCCGEGKMFFNKSCTDTDMLVANPFNPPVYKGTELLDIINSSQHFFYMYNRLCDGKYLVDSESLVEDLYIQEDATLFEISNNQHLWQAPTSYCADMMVTVFSNNETSPPRLVAGVCFPPDKEDGQLLNIAYAVGLLLSVPFLLATFLVYAFISELRNLHGMCLMAYCAGLIIAYPLLAYLKLNVDDIKIFYSTCMSLAFIIYYAFQTSFFWLNIMCFDIWRTFSGYRGGTSNKRREQRRFLLYCLYAWGVPLILTSITIFMQFSDSLPSSTIRPGFGNRRCWFEDWLNELLYFYSPVLILVVCNVILFSVTAHRIRSIKQETAILKGAESARSDKLKRDKQRYALYLKLFMVMGVNWTVEVISFATGGSNWYWVITDLSNLCLGFVIFFIFVWKNKVRNLIRKKLNKWCGVRADGRAPYTESSNGRWATRSSSAPTEVTRVSTEEGLRLKDLH